MQGFQIHSEWTLQRSTFWQNVNGVWLDETDTDIHTLIQKQIKRRAAAPRAHGKTNWDLADGYVSMLLRCPSYSPWWRQGEGPAPVCNPVLWYCDRVSGVHVHFPKHGGACHWEGFDRAFAPGPRKSCRCCWCLAQRVPFTHNHRNVFFCCSGNSY